MAKPPYPSLPPFLSRRTLSWFLLIAFLCSLSYLIGSYQNSKSLSQTTQLSNPNCLQLNLSTPQNPSSFPLDFQPHHPASLPTIPAAGLQPIEFCPKNFTDYCPCQDPVRERQFDMSTMLHRERHCPNTDERRRCLIPRPDGYRTPFSWPKSREFAWFANVPYKRLTESKKKQNWVRLEGDRLVFPGGGTSFPTGVKGYIGEIGRVVPLKTGEVRTVLDIGCGVASFGAYLMDFGILTMSIAPRDIHEAQVQFALERGLPAMLGILSTYRLPYPSRSFDMAHCSRCLVQWAGYGGLYLMEIDRVLRPGAYWVLSGPPINWRNNYKGWQRQTKDLEQEQASIEDLARRLCWKKIAERGAFAVWQKPTNHIHCIRKSKILASPPFCTATDPDAAWCEAFSTYPRTYDLIHASRVLSMYIDKCDILDILLEMDRILRPEGAVIIRDHVDVVVKAKGVADQLRWHSWISHSENGPHHPEKILFVDNSIKVNAKEGTRK